MYKIRSWAQSFSELKFGKNYIFYSQTHLFSRSDPFRKSIFNHQTISNCESTGTIGVAQKFNIVCHIRSPSNTNLKNGCVFAYVTYGEVILKKVSISSLVFALENDTKSHTHKQLLHLFINFIIFSRRFSKRCYSSKFRKMIFVL